LIELNSTPLDRVLEEAASANRDSLNAQLPALEEEIKEGEALQRRRHEKAFCAR